MPETYAVGAAEDPGAVVCRYEKPDGQSSSVATVRISTGVYEATIVPDQPGDWWYRFEGTTPAQAVNESYFKVRERRVS